MERKHFFAAAVFLLIFAASGCTEVTPPEFNNPQDPLTASYPVPAPSSLWASLKSSTELALSWNSWPYEKGCTIERSVDGGAFEKIADLPALTKEYVDSGLDTTKSYSYRLKRFTDLAVSGYSRMVRLQPPSGTTGSLKISVISYSTNNAGAFSHNGNFLVTAYYGKFNQIVFWKAPQYGMDKYIDLWTGPVMAMSFSSDDKLLACGTEDSSIYIYDVNSKALNNIIKGLKGGVTSLDFSPDGRYMAVALKNKDILIYETNSWTPAYTLSRHTNQVNSICFSRDGTLLASGSADGTVILWNTAGWTAQRTINTGESSVMSVAFRPDGQAIAAAAGMSYCQYETSTGNKIRSFLTSGQTALSVAFSNDGTKFAGACGKDMVIYDSNYKPFNLIQDTLEGKCSFNIVLAASGSGFFVTVGNPVSLWAPENSPGSWTISYQ